MSLLVGRDTTLRAGYSQSVGGASFDQSFQLEPSQVAGFNQAFRSLIPESLGGANAGATFTTYGISLEQKFPTRTYLAVEGNLLQSKVARQDGEFELIGANPPFKYQTGNLRERLDFTEWSLAAAAHQLVGRDWSLGAIYRLSRAELIDDFPDITAAGAAATGFITRHDTTARLHTLDLNIIYQNPLGFFARAGSVWTHQENHGDSVTQAGDDFWQANVLTGWRFFHRRAEITVGVLNVTAQNYRLSPLNLYSETPRDRTFYTQFKFQF